MTKDHWYRLIFEEFLDRTEDGFIVVDKDGVITDINQNYCDFLSRKREDIVGKPIGQVITTTSMYDVLSRKLRGDVGRIYIQPYSVGETRDQSEVYAVANRFCFFEEDGTLLGAAAHMKFRQRAMDTARELQELELQYYKEAYQQSFSGKGGFSCIVGQDPKLLELKRYGIQVARTDFPVLITGETGTGKEVFAKAIHLESDRRDGPFIAVNCGAIPDNLLESELFGYEEGAFTGARKGGKPGKFQLANHGTLFLDEIGDMPFPLQVKLLRVLQDQQVERVGGRRPHPCGCAHCGSHPSRPSKAHGPGAVPGGPLLPAGRHQHRDHPPAGAAGGHPAPRQPLSGGAQPEIQDQHRPLGPGKALPTGLLLAGQCPGAPKRPGRGLRLL